MPANPKHKANKSQSRLGLDLFKIFFSTFPGAVLSHFPTSGTKGASCLIWGGEGSDASSGTQALGESRVFPPAITASAQKDPEILS